jgi:CRISPR-associated protein Cmr5
MPIRDIEKERAIFAYEKVDEAVIQAEKDKEDNTKRKKEKIQDSEYKSYCKKIPSLIQTNGLSATFAFIFSKKTGTYIYIYNQVDEWLKKRYNKDNMELVEWCIKLDSNKYRKVTIEVLALFNWLRRFAEGKITKD